MAKRSLESYFMEPFQRHGRFAMPYIEAQGVDLDDLKLIRQEKVYTVVTTDRITQDGRDVIRIISFHRSDDRGVRLYERFIKENLR